jgi:prepilin-type N-terminal cleavage/methylation domain-containing protein
VRIVSKKRVRAFTLIEVMAATVLVGVGMMASYYLLALGTKTNSDARYTALAYQAAQQEIEFVRNMPFQGSTSFSGLQSMTRTASGSDIPRFVTETGADDVSRPTDANYPGYVTALRSLPEGTGGLLVSNDPDPNVGNKLKHVTAIVRWKDGKQTREIAVKTYVSLGGIDPR